jgi:hypothetical protein
VAPLAVRLAIAASSALIAAFAAPLIRAAFTTLALAMVTTWAPDVFVLHLGSHYRGDVGRKRSVSRCRWHYV